MATEGLITRLLADTLDPMSPRILTALLISDLELYTDLQTLIDTLEHPKAAPT